MDFSAVCFYCENFFEGSNPVGLNPTNFEVEIEAIWQAAFHLTNLTTTHRDAVFLVD